MLLLPRLRPNRRSPTSRPARRRLRNEERLADSRETIVIAEPTCKVARTSTNLLIRRLFAAFLAY